MLPQEQERTVGTIGVDCAKRFIFFQSFGSISVVRNDVHHLSNDGLDLLLGLGALTETVLEATVDIGQVAHATGTGGLSADALVAPVVYLQ